MQTMLLINDAIPNKYTFISILKDLRNKPELCAGRRVHACIKHSDFKSDVAVGTALLSMYGKCGSPDDALKAFDEMPERNVVSWNVMISICARQGQGKDAHRLFQQMLFECVIANNVTFVSTLQAYSSQVLLEEGKRLHTCILGITLEPDVIVANALLTMYSKCGRPKDAQKIFSIMPQRTVVSWTALITSYVQQGCFFESLYTFQTMQESGAIPNSFTIVTLLSACANQAALAQGKWLHHYLIFYHLNPDGIIANALIRMYSKCGSLEDACKLFEDSNGCDVVSWTTIIAAYAQHRLGLKALQVFKTMQDRGVPADKVGFMSILDAFSSQDAFAEGKWVHASILSNGFEQDVSVGTALVNMYGKCGQAEYAWYTFDRMQNRNMVTWNTMIAVFAQQGQARKAFELLHQMEQEGLIPNMATFVGILDACASKVNLLEGKCMHARIICSGFGTELTLETALIHMYGKNGNLEKACLVFSTSFERDIASWNAMIAVFSQHGKGKEAIQLFHQMYLKGVVPDEITFMGILLACSHCGLVDEGWNFFWLMDNVYSIQPDVEHYNCMVDLLGRAGCLDVGEGLIKRMPCQPNATTWTALLGACRMHLNLEQGENAARNACKLEPKDTGTHILLSNIHISARAMC